MLIDSVCSGTCAPSVFFFFNVPSHSFVEKAMATHSSVLAWKIPGSGEPWWAAIYGVAQSRT